jgi:NitT/TauT family transport system permease protein
LPPEDAEPLALYAGDTWLRSGVVTSNEPPDGRRDTFTFSAAHGPVIVDGVVQEPGEDYAASADTVTFAIPPPFAGDVRRVSGDYAILDADAGTLVIAAEIPAGTDVRLASEALRLAERLVGEIDGSNRRFQLARTPVVENDRERIVLLDDRALSAQDERPAERVDGTRSVFTFPSPRGVIMLEGRALIEGAGYERDGTEVRLAVTPERNARLRQHVDYAMVDHRSGEILLAEAPEPGSVLWAQRYNYYSEPSCGSTVLECFYALPQHPVPFPHWIAASIGPFVTKYSVTDPRNVVRATFYTTLGTLYALLLGAAVGVLLAVVFVLFRPVERALLPWVIASQTVPIIALVPVMLLVLGNFGITVQTSLLPTAIIGAYIAFFPVVVSTVKGLRSVDPLALDLMRSYAATPWQVFRKVRFPAAVPFFFTSLKLGTAAALVGALVAETESNNRRGLGFQILGQVQSGNVADVWILLILSGLLGIALVGLVGVLERIMAPWRRA